MPDSKREQILANWLTVMSTIPSVTAKRLAVPFTPQGNNVILLILSGGEVPNTEDENFSQLARILTVANIVRFRNGTETQVNALLQQIYEKAMADPYQAGLATKTEWLSHSEVELNEDGNQAQVTAVYGVHYRHDPFDESL